MQQNNVNDYFNSNRWAYVSAILSAARSDGEFEDVIKRIFKLTADYGDIPYIRFHTVIKQSEMIYIYDHECDELVKVDPETQQPASGYTTTCSKLATVPYVYSDASGCSEGCEDELKNTGAKATFLFTVNDNDNPICFVGFSDRKNERVWEGFIKTLASDLSDVLATYLKYKTDIISKGLKSDTLITVLDNIDSYVCVTDIVTNVIIYANDSFCATFGDDVIGKTYSSLLGDCQKASEFSNRNDSIVGDVKNYDCFCEKTQQWFDITERYIIWNGGKTVLLHTINDISNIVEYEKVIEREAFTDNLTGLYNRRNFEISLNTISKLAKRNNEKGYLVLLDLDNFKNINDSLGYRYGDNLLVSVANKLRELEAMGISVYRFGGDEFALIVPPAAYDKMPDVMSFLDLAFKKEWLVIDTMFYYTVSIGYVCFPDDGVGTSTLMKKADMALYSAKREGKNRARGFEPEIEQSALRKYEIERSMRNDVADNCRNFEVFYQPIINADTKKLVGAEALLRWKSDTLGYVGPSEFISVSENLGLINRIGEFVMRSASKQAKKWLERYGDNFKISINLSVCQLVEADFVRSIKSIFDEDNVPLKSIIFEVTESLAINDMQKMKSVLNAIRDLGANIALDDFGTGYSSLNCFKQMPLTTVKLDKSLLDDIETNPTTNVFIKSLVDMTHGFDMKVCAEGVETEGQYEILKNGNVDVIQGYYFGRPCTTDKFEELF